MTVKTLTQADLDHMEHEAGRMFSKARIKMLSGGSQSKVTGDDRAKFMFFGDCVMNLTPAARWNIDTAATDGDHVFYNPYFWLHELDNDSRVGVLVHEVLHCTNKHHTRRGDRDPELWNLACDLAINPIVRDCGLKLTDGCLWPAEWNLAEYMSAEWYYSRLPQEMIDKYLGDKDECQGGQGGEGGDEDADGEGDQDGNGDGKPGKGKGGDKPGDGKGKAKGKKGLPGGVIDAAPDQAGKTASDNKWGRIAGAAAERASKAGNLPGSLQTSIKKFGKPQVDYWHVLRNFFSARAKDDYTWSRPSRRSIASGQYLPAAYSERLGEVVILVDCSGSCWDESILKRFCSEMGGVRDLMPSRLIVLYHDTEIQGEPVIVENGEEFEVKMTGGGGTSHVQPFEWIDENLHEVECILCLTDLMTSFPSRAPIAPVLWISTAGDQAPFGEVLKIDV